MALGTQQQNTNAKIYLNAKHVQDKKPIDPHFERKAKNPETGKYETIERPTWVSGTLTRVFPKDSVFIQDGKEKKVKMVDVEIKDGDDTYVLSLNYRRATRDLFNKLITLESFDNIKISYTRNKKSFDTMYLDQNGQSVRDGFLTYDEMKAKTTKYLDGNDEEQTNYNELNKFLQGKLEELNVEITGVATAASSPEKEGAKAEVEEDDSLPF